MQKILSVTALALLLSSTLGFASSGDEIFSEVRNGNGEKGKVYSFVGTSSSNEACQIGMTLEPSQRKQWIGSGYDNILYFTKTSVLIGDRTLLSAESDNIFVETNTRLLNKSYFSYGYDGVLVEFRRSVFGEINASITSPDSSQQFCRNLVQNADASAENSSTSEAH